MDDIIQRLSDIEACAVSLIEDADKQKQQLAADLKSKLDIWDKAMEEQTKNSLITIKAESEKNIRMLLDKQRAVASKEMLDLTEEYEKNHTKYVDELFEALSND